MSAFRQDTETEAGQFELGLIGLLTAPFVLWAAGIYTAWLRSGVIGGMLGVLQILLADIRLFLVLAVVAAGLAALRPSVPARRRLAIWLLVGIDVIANLMINSRLHPY